MRPPVSDSDYPQEVTLLGGSRRSGERKRQGRDYTAESALLDVESCAGSQTWSCTSEY